MTDPTLTPVLLMSGIGAPPSFALWSTVIITQRGEHVASIKTSPLHFHRCLSASFSSMASSSFSCHDDFMAPSNLQPAPSISSTSCSAAATAQSHLRRLTLGILLLEQQLVVAKHGGFF
ncbi:uncharacterized protein LOC121991967 isoform X1 [Zingiber officinale]|uniref:uncharacterized protein LOC121991967 isoform X1 n=1 Tax=Zingiber officinale TaxID=94328 RepID=UPI001C4B31BC|nr:uncharacterized protein LOC121991967 isoform X1 [Zingiber officinale]